MRLKAPFPYFGGKSKVAHLVWEHMGDVKTYIEPFGGSAAILLGNPKAESLELEILNDFDGMVTNVWRSIKWSPTDVLEWLSWPMNELDLHSRSQWVEGQREALEGTLQGEDLTDILRRDPHYHNPQIAGWWIWGMCSAIGDAFTEQKKAIPAIYTSRGIYAKSFDPEKTIQALSTRLKHTRIACGDWKRVMGDNVLNYKTPTGVFLDPPYANVERHDTYKHESYTVASEVNEWCLTQGDNPNYRIILAGYEGDYDLPESWRSIAWKTSGGYGNITRVENGVTRGKENSGKERLWISPGCINDYEKSVFHSFLSPDEVK